MAQVGDDEHKNQSVHDADTMAYTAAALSFMLEHLGKPVVLTGSQIPCVETRSDGHENLIGALLAAGTLPIPEVWPSSCTVYMADSTSTGYRILRQ